MCPFYSVSAVRHEQIRLSKKTGAHLTSFLFSTSHWYAQIKVVPLFNTKILKRELCPCFVSPHLVNKHFHDNKKIFSQVTNILGLSLFFQWVPLGTNKSACQTHTHKLRSYPLLKKGKKRDTPHFHFPTQIILHNFPSD